MSDPRERKDYCDAGEQKDVVEKLTNCDKNSTTSEQRVECYAKVVEDNGCVTS